MPQRNILILKKKSSRGKEKLATTRLYEYPIDSNLLNVKARIYLVFIQHRSPPSKVISMLTLNVTFPYGVLN